jgi:hypothetical protein
MPMLQHLADDRIADRENSIASTRQMNGLFERFMWH